MWESIIKLMYEHTGTYTENVNLKIVSENGTVVIIVGKTKLKQTEEERAYGYILHSDSKITQDNPESSEWSGDMKLFNLNRLHWKLWKKAELKPHWPAVYKMKNSSGFGLTKSLFDSEAEATRYLTPGSFVKLARENNPIMLERDQ